MRTVVNVRAGGLTPISGVLHALVLLAVVLGLGSVASTIPHVVLAAILIKVGTDIIDWDYLKRVHRSSVPGVVVMFVVLFITVFIDLIMAVGVGMTMACLIFLKRQSDYQLKNVNFHRHIDEDAPLGPEESRLMKASEGHVLLLHIGGPVSFGAAKDLTKMLDCEEAFQVLVFDLGDVPVLDYTASRSIEDMINNTLAAERKVALVMPKGQPAKLLQRENVLSQLSDDAIHTSRVSALAYANTLVVLDESEKA